MRFVCLIVVIAAFVAGSAADDLSVARQALRDGLWKVARSHVEASVTNAVSRLIVLESYAGEGDWKSIADRLGEWKDAKGDAFDYYRAVLRNDHSGAMNILRRGGSAEGTAEAMMYEADELAKSGNRKGAETLWRNVASISNASDRAFARAAASLMDASLLREAANRVKAVSLRRMVSLRLGTLLLNDRKTAAEGERIIRAVVKDSPDADGAGAAFLALADAALGRGSAEDALKIAVEATDIWPDLVKRPAVHSLRGWALAELNRDEEALEAFGRAETLAGDDETKAAAAVKCGDVLSAMGRGEEAMARYREVSKKFPNTRIASRLTPVLKLRELEVKGRDAYRNFRFDEARLAFAAVAAGDPSRAERMRFFEVLCLYGAGADVKARNAAEALSESCRDPKVRADVTMWLAKFLFNRREYRQSRELFVRRAGMDTVRFELVPEALLWAARAAFAEADFALAVKLSTELVEKYPNAAVKTAALLLQGEALIELSRFEEASLVLERAVVTEDATSEERLRSRLLQADALFAIGADNPARYAAALEEYRALLFGGTLTSSEKITVSFKIARTLEKLKRMDEAVDRYYSGVVIAYRDGRERGEFYDDGVRAVFSKSALRLADEFESRGRDHQAIAVLEIVAASDVPAAEEAKKRLERIKSKGRFL